MSNLASSTDGAEDQSFRADEQPAQEQTIGPPENSGEKENGGLSAVKTPSMISNAGPSQPSERHEQESASKVVPDSDLASWAEKDQPTLGELAHIMEKVLDVLRNSTIAHNSDKDNRSSFWGIYKRVATEYDDQFLVRYDSDMSDILLISGLLSAASMSFIVTMESNLSPDPCDTTNALLAQLVQIGLGNLTAAGSMHADPASTWSPTVLAVRIQMFAYTSLSMSLLAAFGVILGKQWLGYYKSHRYGRGSEEERGKRRQEKFDGIVTWYFDAVVQTFPVILQISLLLFGIALGANMWYDQRSIAWVIIATTVFGFLFYSLTVMACLISPACPFQTPTSTMLRMLRIDRVLRLMYKRASSYSQQLTKSLHDVLARLVDIVRPGWNRLSAIFRGPVRAIGTFAQRSLQQLITSLHKWLGFVLGFPTKVGDSEAQSLNLASVVSSEDEYAITLPDIPTSNLEAPSVKWLLETSTDPEVFLAAASLVPQVEWPLGLDVSDMLHQLYDIYMSCVGFHGQIMPSLEEKASACLLAMSHLYCGRVLQAHPTRGEFLGCNKRDDDTFCEMITRDMDRANMTVLNTTRNLCFPQDEDRRFLWFSLYDCPGSVAEWLSHSLPYHFVTGRANEKVEIFAIEVISKLLSSTASPSNQIMANCTLLACVMVGVQFDKKDIVRIDKSSALPLFVNALVEQFQTTLWVWYGGDLSGNNTGVAPSWACDFIEIICLALESAKNYYYPSFPAMRNLDACRKIYSRVRSSEQNPSWELLGALQYALRFTLAAAKVSRDPADLWNMQYFWMGDSHSPEDFDWLVDYLEYIDSDNQEAVFDILLLLVVIKVRCSAAKQNQFFKCLIACMGSDMPVHLRHAALRLAHSAREEIVSISAIDNAELRDMILTEFSPAILTAISPQPGATLSKDGPDRFVRDDHDLCYLELLFALARNSNWHPHLFADHHIDRCISIVAKANFAEYAFYLAGIFLRIAPEQSSVTSLNLITEHQWWDMMRSAWLYARFQTDDIHCFEFLPVLVEGTKRYMHVAAQKYVGWKFHLRSFIENVDYVVNALEGQDSQQGEDNIVAVKELRTAASDMLEELVSSQGVVSP